MHSAMLHMFTVPSNPRTVCQFIAFLVQSVLEGLSTAFVFDVSQTVSHFLVGAFMSTKGSHLHLKFCTCSKQVAQTGLEAVDIPAGFRMISGNSQLISGLGPKLLLTLTGQQKRTHILSFFANRLAQTACR